MGLRTHDIATLAAAAGRRPLRVWVDVDNPPQVQYLLPVAHAFVRRGDDVRLTARDYGMTHELLRQRGETFEPVGRHFGGSLRAKVLGTLDRAARLWRLHRRRGVPDLVVSNSRSAAIAASMLRIPSFAIIDYEFVNLAAFRLARSYVVHPDVIPLAAFERRGMRASLLLPFSGIKEHLTFGDLDIDDVTPCVLPLDNGLKRILVRPPAEQSHYHRAESTAVAKTLLARLAGESDVVVVFSARYPDQVDQLATHRFVNKPVVLDRAVPFLSLLKAVDAVVSGGGTMIREAAYLGLPAITTFQGEPGAIDAYLESLGRLHVIRSAADVEALDVSSLERHEAMSAAGSVADEVATMIANASATHTRNGFARVAA